MISMELEGIGNLRIAYISRQFVYCFTDALALKTTETVNQMSDTAKQLGVGFEFNIDYEDFDARFVETKRTIPQRTIDLTLCFIDGYNGFTRWREYLTKSKEIRLFYETDAGKKYCYINVLSSSYNGVTPTRDEDSEYVYEFGGWN